MLQYMRCVARERELHLRSQIGTAPVLVSKLISLPLLLLGPRTRV